MSGKPLLDDGVFHGNPISEFTQTFSKADTYTLPEILAQHGELIAHLERIIGGIERPTFDDAYNKFVVREAKIFLERIKGVK
ncbi:hypothetical protein [Aeromonas caviae]|uniref:hypothetical protein n=1 Tax=Aeromonas caviae TaxID=648 RepID=UPI001CC7A8F0|nr:hypothetical protein [Aeromonas caviae]GJA84684.1 hypothetical protein KAM356_07430 [Aeromonas caviae]GJA88718.1 hypothetical protein KAM357_06660 [Aeromonas caviae]GJB35963.1 hypothetical protein KAM368_05300 [Aeromonas caviae]